MDFEIARKPHEFRDQTRCNVHMAILYALSKFKFGYGLNLNLMEHFKIIQCPIFHWIWAKTHDALGNVSDMKTTLLCTWKTMKICKELLDFIFQIYTIGIGNWIC